MDKLTQYRQAIQDILTEHSQIQPAYGEIQMKLLFDVDHDRYQLLRTGWQDERRVYGTLIHMDLKAIKFGFNMTAPKSASPTNLPIAVSPKTTSYWHTTLPSCVSIMVLLLADSSLGDRCFSQHNSRDRSRLETTAW
jgi:hypothetical protein